MKGTEKNKSNAKDLIRFINAAAIKRIEKCDKAIEVAEGKGNTDKPVYKNSIALKQVMQELLNIQWDGADADVIADICGNWKTAIGMNPKIIIAEAKARAGAK